MLSNAPTEQVPLQVIDARHRLEELTGLRESAVGLEARINEKTEEVKSLKLQLAVNFDEASCRYVFPWL